jgi:tetratricopeptide (TPR) repeat protein
LPVLEEATRLAEGVGAPETVRTASYFAATAHLAQGAFGRSRASSRRALVAAEQVGDPGWVAVASSELGFCLFHQGDWAEAQVYLERGAEMASRLGPSFISSWSLAYLGQFYVGLGAWEDAAHAFDEALTMAKRLQWSALQWYVQSCLAELEVLRGCPDAAVALLEPVLDEPDVDWRSAVMLPATLAWAYLARDDVTAADEMAERAASEAVRRQDLVHMVGSLRVQGMVLSRQRRRERAETTFQEALALARTMAYPYAEARILVEYGLLHGQRGEPDPARKRLEEALAVFQRLGAKKDIERTEQALAGIN